MYNNINNAFKEATGFDGVTDFVKDLNGKIKLEKEMMVEKVAKMSKKDAGDELIKLKENKLYGKNSKEIEEWIKGLPDLDEQIYSFYIDLLFEKLIQ